MYQQQVIWAFSILGIHQNSSREDAKRAYRNLCKKYHPDTNLEGGDTSREYIYVNQAYEIVNQYFTCMEIYKEQMLLQMQRNASWTLGGRVYGDNAETRKNYEQMQQRKSETGRLRKWEKENEQKEKEQKRMIYEKYKNSRGLPSQRQENFKQKQEMKKEAERIAGIIERLLKEGEFK